MAAHQPAHYTTSKPTLTESPLMWQRYCVWNTPLNIPTSQSALCGSGEVTPAFSPADQALRACDAGCKYSGQLSHKAACFHANKESLRCAGANPAAADHIKYSSLNWF